MGELTHIKEHIGKLMGKVEERVMEHHKDYKCPNCSYEFGPEEGFWWGEDDHGDPTVENVSCPKCGASTIQTFSCRMCHQKFKCTLEEECAPCEYWKYEEFENN